MPSTRPWRAVTGLGFGALLAAAGAAYTFRAPIQAAYWTRWVGPSPLTAAEQAAIASCADPGWSGLVKVITQGAAPCGPAWFATQAAAHLDGARRDWLSNLARSRGATPTQRAQAASALLWTRPEDGSLAPLVVLALSAPDSPTEWVTGAAAHLAALDTPVDWADPRLAGRVAVLRLEAGDTTAAREVADLLYADGLAPTMAPEARAHATEVALNTVGLDAATLGGWLTRMDHGRPLDGPWPLVRAFTNEGVACRRLDDPACARLAARLLELLADGSLDEGEPEVAPERARPTPARLPEPLWRLRFGDPAQVERAADTLGAVAAWVRAGAPEERPGRLLAALAHPVHGWADDDALAGEPLAAAGFRRGSPWATALAIVAVAEVAEVDAQVLWSERGLRVRADRLEAALTTCPAPSDAPPPPDTEIPAQAVLANAMLESAFAAARRGDHAGAVGFAALAARTDPAAGAAQQAVDAALAAPEARVDHAAAVQTARLVLHASTPRGPGWWDTPCPAPTH